MNSFLKGKLYKFSNTLTAFVKIFDSLAFIFSFYIFNKSLKIDESTDLILVIFFILFCNYFFRINNLYKSLREKTLVRIFITLFLTSLVAISSIFLILNFISNYKIDSYSYFISSFLYLVFVSINHIFLRFCLKKSRLKGRNIRDIVFCGSDLDLDNFNNQLNQDNWLGYKLIAWFTENSIDTENSKFHGIYKGDINELDYFLKNNLVFHEYFSLI